MLDTGSAPFAIGTLSPGRIAKKLLSGLFGACVPRSTPAGIIDKLNEEINGGLADPKIKSRIADSGGMVFAGPPSDYGTPIADEIEK